MKQIYILSVILLLSMHCNSILAAENQAPVQIEADHMVSMQKDNSVIFSGKVEAKQDTLLIRSSEMTVYYSSSDSQQQISADNTKEIKKIFAKGNVEITQQEWVATGDTAEYFATERKVILTGNTKVWQDNNMVTGEKFVMYLDEGKSVVEKSTKKGERVKAFFYPDTTDTQKK